MSTRLIQDLHAGISRRDWSAVEAASNRLRDDIEETIRILAGTDISSLPRDYPLPRIAERCVEARRERIALIEMLKTALEPFAADTVPCLRKTERGYNKHGLRCLMSPMEIARLGASKALAAAKEQSA